MVGEVIPTSVGEGRLDPMSNTETTTPITADDEAAYDEHVRASNEAMEPGGYDRNRKLLAALDAAFPPSAGELETRAEMRTGRIRRWIEAGRPAIVEIR